MRRAPLIVLLAAAVAAWTLVGCGSGSSSMGTASLARSIERSLARERGVHAPVRCPAAVPRRAGFRFTCDARLEVGDYPIAVLVRSSRGEMRYGSPEPLVVLDTAKVAHAIEASVRAQRGRAAHARCPRQVLQRTGIVFSCAVSLAGSGRYAVVVRQIDGAGRVRYAGTDRAL